MWVNKFWTILLKQQLPYVLFHLYQMDITVCLCVCVCLYLYRSIPTLISCVSILHNLILPLSSLWNMPFCQCLFRSIILFFYVTLVVSLYHFYMAFCSVFLYYIFDLFLSSRYDFSWIKRIHKIRDIVCTVTVAANLCGFFKCFTDIQTLA